MHAPLAPLSHNTVHTWKSKQLNAYSSWSGCLSIHNLSLQGFSINIPTRRAINQNEKEQSRPAEEQENTLQAVLQKAVINYYQLKAVADRAIPHLTACNRGMGKWTEVGEKQGV